MKRVVQQLSRAGFRRSTSRVVERWPSVHVHGSSPLQRAAWMTQQPTQRWNSSSTATVASSGEDQYQQAIQASERAAQIQKDQEEAQNERMFQAWKNAQEAEKSPRAQGVKVVQTLVSETRKQKKNKGEETAEYWNEQEQIFLEKAALQHQHPLALVQLGNRTLQALKKSKQTNHEKLVQIHKAMDMFRNAGEKGNRVGYYNLGQLLWTGYPAWQVDDPLEAIDEEEDLAFKESQILKPDVHQAMDIFTEAIDLGDVDAMYLVGVHRMSAGGSEGLFSGYKLIQKAGDLGHGGALYYLALLHLNGEEKLSLEPCSKEQFMERLDRAVHAGDLDATFTRAHSYFHGTEGYEQNYDKALLDFLRAADEGHADSAVSAGAIFHQGIEGGIEQDQAKAFQLYQRAGELGSKEGWQNVVDCYRTGAGVPMSTETAQYIEDTILQDK